MRYQPVRMTHNRIKLTCTCCSKQVQEVDAFADLNTPWTYICKDCLPTSGETYFDSRGEQHTDTK